MKFYLTSHGVNYTNKTAKLRYYSKHATSYPNSLSFEATCRVLNMYNISYTTPDTYTKSLKKIFIAFNDLEKFQKVFKLVTGEIVV